MAWIESHQELQRHPKTLKAARLLDVSPVTIIGHLHVLWWWAMDYAPDGDLSDFDSVDVAGFAEWDGDPDRFVDALVGCGSGERFGFLESDAQGRMTLHDWHEFGGKLHAKKEQDAARKRRARKGSPPLTSNDADVRGTSDGHPTDVPRMSQVEERRGEEKRGQERTTTSPRSSSELVPSEAPSADVSSDEKLGWAIASTDVELVQRVTRKVAAMIAENGHPLPAKGSKKADSWFKAMDLLLRLGPAGETTTPPPSPDVVLEVARWATSGGFWPPHIKDVMKLREKWSTLALQATGGSGEGGSAGLDAVAAYMRKAAS